jgi:hypothetical protein
LTRRQKARRSAPRAGVHGERNGIRRAPLRTTGRVVRVAPRRLRPESVIEMDFLPLVVH